MKTFKKLILSFLVLIITSLFITSFIRIKAEATKPSNLVIHYFRYNGDYSDNWNFWLWQKAPTDGAGASYNFDKVDGQIVTDNYGAVATIDLTTTSFVGSTKVGVIIRKGEWTLKDIDTDRFMDIPETSEDGKVHFYFVEGDERIGTSLNDPNGPDRTDKVRYAYFSNESTIKFALTSPLTSDLVSLEINNELTSDYLCTLTGSSGTLKLNSKVDFSKSYVFKANFADGTKTYNVTFDGLYDTESFNTAYGYNGDDLGCTFKDNKTIFKLWAPISNKVVLNLYKTGTPSVYTNGSDVKEQTVEMVKGEKGVWEATVNDNLHGHYYTYSVTNGLITNEVVDPYAKSAGVNGLRGMIIDFSKINPNGFSYNTRANNITNATDAIIYELHVRDLTSHSSWNGPNEYRGKFMGLTVSGTTYKDVTTGLDHIKELGVTHVQLLPIFDHGVVDESKTNTAFNWGYMPLNFNVPEGSYSTDAFDGVKRVVELKQASMTLNNNNIGVIMDVVYNHTGKSADSNFNLIVPGYYYRMNNDGSFSNGSGCGNETASERYMMRKFIVDSVCFWASEYNFSGFRFDLMALHDVETMKAVETALHQIDPKILVYGEPWNGGATPLSTTISADKNNLAQIGNVAAFNDEMRDAIKGSVFSSSEGGFIQGNVNPNIINKLKYGIVGGTNHPNITTTGLSYNKVWNTSPLKTINYVSAHDNNTLYDKIVLSTSSKMRDLRDDMQKQANAIVLTSQGIAFIHAGAEFMRSKPSTSGGYDSNSYESPDSTNQLRWDLKANDTNLSCYNYYCGLIALRKAHPAFRMTTASEISKNVSFLYENNSNIIAYQISNNANNDTWNNILVIHSNCTNQLTTLTLPTCDGTWNVVCNTTKISNTSFKTYESGAKINVFASETVILYNGETLPTPEPVKSGCKKKTDVIVSSFLLASSIICFLPFRKKETL